MPSSYLVRLLAALFLIAVPASAGTLYVPVVTPDGPPDATYQTRVWLTNQGNGPATVTTVRIRGTGNGTESRDAPVTHRIAAGATEVLTPAGGSGLLEVRAPATVAVDAEIRNQLQSPQASVFGKVPVIGSDEMVPGLRSLVLQGIRRTPEGVRTTLGLVNLAHQPTRCEIEITAASGNRLGIARDLPIPALSNVTVDEVLELVGVDRMADANARVSCNRRFYAYLAVTAGATGETVFVEPSATGRSTLTPPGETGDSGGGGDQGSGNESGGKSVVWTRNGLIHTPTRANPTWTHDIQTPPRTDFRKVVVSVDVTPGRWYSGEPEKPHSLFWLNRGGRWPSWHQNAIGFANAHGPGNPQVRAISNLGKPNRPYSTVAHRGITLQRGVTYRLRYEYDAAGGKIHMQMSRAGKVLFRTSTRAAVKRIRSDGSGKFMLYFGHDNHVPGSNNGPERPSYGWKYANARVEFVR